MLEGIGLSMKLLDDLEKEIIELYGERCKIKDYEDFPDIIKRGSSYSRCPNCKVWELFDDLKNYIMEDTSGLS